MTLTAPSLLLLALAFAGIAFLGEYVALAQMRRCAFSSVPLVRTARRALYPALLACAGFLLYAGSVNFRLTVVSMAIGTFVGCIIALPSLSRGLLYQPTMRLIAPVMLVFVVGSHIDGVGAAPTLELGLLPALSTLLVCGLLWLIAEYRHHQDMERLRD